MDLELFGHGRSWAVRSIQFKLGHLSRAGFAACRLFLPTLVLISQPSTRQATHGWLIANLLAQICFGLLAMTICLPSMQEWGTLFGRSQAMVQLSFSAYVVTYGAFQLVYGPLSDRHGRRGVLVVGLLLAAAGAVMAALAPSLEVLIVARALQGAGSAAGMVVGRSSVQDLFQGAERTRVMAFIGMTLGLCPPAATLIGGQLHVQIGWQAGFVLMAVLSVLLLVAAWWGLPSAVKSPGTPNHWLADMARAYGRLAREPDFWLYVVVLASTTATFYAFLAGAPLVLGSYGVGPDHMGWFIMAVPLAYILGNYLTSQWIHHKGEHRMMVLGLCWSLAGLLQQLMGAVGGYAVGLVSHDGAVNLGLLMTGFTLCSGLALELLKRR